MAFGHRVTSIAVVRLPGGRPSEPQPDGEGTKRPSHHLREVIAVVPVVLACLAFTIATPAVWAKRNFLDTNRFVQRAGPLAKDPAVQQALTVRLTDEITAVIRPENLFRSALPERGQILAVPLSAAVQQFIQKVVSSFVQSTAFQKLWTTSLTVAHKAAMGVLNGNRRVLVVQNGVVTLDLVPIINAILTAINAVTPDVLGHDIKLPTISPSDQTNAASERLSAALNERLPKDFGQVVVYKRNKLAAIQEGVHLFNRFVVLAVVLALVFAIAGLWLTKRRRRDVVILAAGVALGMVLVRRAVFRVQHNVTNLPAKETGRQAAAAVLHAFLWPLTTFAAWAIGAAILVIVVAYITSANPRAVAIRHRTAALGRAAWSGTAESGATALAKDHRGLLQGAGLVLAIAVLWIVDLSAWGIAAIIAVLILYELLILRLARTVEPSTGGAGSSTRGAGSELKRTA
jgi:hypothetical protein